MKYTLSNTIDTSLSIVKEKMSNADGTKEWTEGLQSAEQILGTYCEVGSQRKLRFLYKNKEMEMTETILEQNLPEQIKFAYGGGMVSNTVELKFEKIAENQVKQTCNTEMKMSGVMKFFGFMMKGMFKKQTMKYMVAFKDYAERKSNLL